MLNLVADLSHYNANPNSTTGELDFRQAYQVGLRAVIHKATEGTSERDGQYEKRKPQAVQAGLLWGAYHFGSAGEGEAQAAHFLACVGKDPHMVLVLDFEQSRAGGLNMTTHQAEQFVQYIRQQTGRYPGLYSDPAYLQLTQAHSSRILRQCWLWLASYEQREEPPLQLGWPHWTMWQYTDGKQGWPPHTVKGFGLCDRSQFNGQLDDLRQLWGYPAAPAPAIVNAPMVPVVNLPVSLPGPGGATKQALTSTVASLKSEGLKFGTTLLASVPITHALYVGIMTRIASLTRALAHLGLTNWEREGLLALLVIAGCYLARLTAAHVGTIAMALPPEEPAG